MLCLEQLVIAYCGAIKIFSVKQNRLGQGPHPLVSPPSNQSCGHLSRSHFWCVFISAEKPV